MSILFHSVHWRSMRFFLSSIRASKRALLLCYSSLIRWATPFSILHPEVTFIKQTFNIFEEV